MTAYPFYDFFLNLLLYGFFGWIIEVLYYSVRDRRFVNRGFVNLPIHVPCGIAFAILVEVLPSLGRHYLLQFVAAAAVFSAVYSLAGVFGHRMSSLARLDDESSFSGTRKNWLEMCARAAGGVLICRIVHPVVMAGILLLPGWLVHLAVWIGAALLVADFFVMLYAVRFHRELPGGETARKQTQRFADRLTRHIWNRLSRAYPGIEKSDGDREKIVFAEGLCLDKIVWLFLICAMLGDGIETLYCGLVNGHWMNRSSVLYGPFSFVWGIGAVVLTVALRKMADKSDRYIFVGGFVIGGTYEYLCSVFTELFFGTVFWDYSDMPLNIGGRTNVLFCFFWGLLAVVWVKILYPPLCGYIEKIPPLPGKILTWAVVLVMVCNGLLTSAAMLRYRTRAERPEADGTVEAFLDAQYDDAYMEARWPNMIVADGETEPE